MVRKMFYFDITHNGFHSRLSTVIGKWHGNGEKGSFLLVVLLSFSFSLSFFCLSISVYLFLVFFLFVFLLVHAIFIIIPLQGRTVWEREWTSDMHVADDHKIWCWYAAINVPIRIDTQCIWKVYKPQRMGEWKGKRNGMGQQSITSIDIGRMF